MLVLEPPLGAQSNELDPAYAQFRDQSRFWIQRVAVPLLMVIGLFGNSITMIIMTRRGMRSTTNMYLAALAFVDMLYLVLTFLLGLSHYPNMAGSKYYAYWRLRPFLMMLTDACSNTSVWLTVTFTIERYIAVKYPMKGKVWCTEKRAKMMIICVFVIGTLFAAPVPFEWKVIEKQMTDVNGEQQQQTNRSTSVVGDTNKGENKELAGSTATSVEQSFNLNLLSITPRASSNSEANQLVTNVSDQNQLTSKSNFNNKTTTATTLALDYSDFGRNETYKTIYYCSTAVIFYFVPLFSLMLFNGFLIKSVHQSQRERTKMTGRTTSTSTTTSTTTPRQGHGKQGSQHVVGSRTIFNKKQSNQLMDGQDGKSVSSMLVGVQSTAATTTSPPSVFGQEKKLSIERRNEQKFKLLLSSRRHRRNRTSCSQDSNTFTSSRSFRKCPLIGQNSKLTKSELFASDSLVGKQTAINNQQNVPLLGNATLNTNVCVASDDNNNNNNNNNAGNEEGENEATSNGEKLKSVVGPTKPATMDNLEESLSSKSNVQSDCDNEAIDSCLSEVRATTIDSDLNEVELNGSSKSKSRSSQNQFNEVSIQRNVHETTSINNNNNNNIKDCATTRSLRGRSLKKGSEEALFRQPIKHSASTKSSLITLSAGGINKSPHTTNSKSGCGTGTGSGSNPGQHTQTNLNSNLNASFTSSSQQTIVPASSQERRITIMLIAVVILFLFCQIPSAAMLLYTSVREMNPNTNEHALVLAFGNIFNFLVAVNAAGNFILYSFLSKKYRRTFVILFCSCFGSRKKQTNQNNQPNRTVSVRFSNQNQANTNNNLNSQAQTQKNSHTNIYPNSSSKMIETVRRDTLV